MCLPRFISMNTEAEGALCPWIIKQNLSSSSRHSYRKLYASVESGLLL